MADVFDKKYVYQVARLRTHELSLLDAQATNNLCSFKTIKELISFLKEKGFGKEDDKTVAKLIVSERKKLWELIDELVNDKSVFDVFRLKNDYNNIKAIIKESVVNKTFENVIIEETTLDVDAIRLAVRDRNYQLLSDELVEPVSKAHEVLLKSQDVQKADLIIDRACLDAMLKAKESADDDFLKMYAELMVATANIKIAYRAILTRKDEKFLLDALAECDTLNKTRLIESTLKGLDSFYSFLESTDYAESVPLLKESFLAFEKWCTDKIVKRMKEELYNSFGIGPIASYILAKENELKNVKIVAAGIENGLPVEKIQERLVETYV